MEDNAEGVLSTVVGVLELEEFFGFVAEKLNPNHFLKPLNKYIIPPSPLRITKLTSRINISYDPGCFCSSCGFDGEKTGFEPGQHTSSVTFLLGQCDVSIITGISVDEQNCKVRIEIWGLLLRRTTAINQNIINQIVDTVKAIFFVLGYRGCVVGY